MPSHHIISKVYTINMISLVDVNLYHLDNVMFVRFLHWKIIPSLFLYCTLQKEVTLCIPQLVEWRVMFHHLT